MSQQTLWATRCWPHPSAAAVSACTAVDLGVVMRLHVGFHAEREEMRESDRGRHQQQQGCQTEEEEGGRGCEEERVR